MSKSDFNAVIKPLGFPHSNGWLEHGNFPSKAPSRSLLKKGRRFWQSPINLRFIQALSHCLSNNGGGISVRRRCQKTPDHHHSDLQMHLKHYTENFNEAWGESDDGVSTKSSSILTLTFKNDLLHTYMVLQSAVDAPIVKRQHVLFRASNPLSFILARFFLSLIFSSGKNDTFHGIFRNEWLAVDEASFEKRNENFLFSNTTYRQFCWHFQPIFDWSGFSFLAIIE